MASYTDEELIANKQLSADTISLIIAIAKNYLFEDVSIPSNKPLFFVSPTMSWNYTYPSYLLTEDEDDAQKLYDQAKNITKQIKSNASQHKIDNDFAELILTMWQDTFAFGVFESIDGTYQKVSKHAKYIRIYSFAKSTPFIEKRSKDGIIALTPHD